MSIVSVNIQLFPVVKFEKDGFVNYKLWKTQISDEIFSFRIYLTRVHWIAFPGRMCDPLLCFFGIHPEEIIAECILSIVSYLWSIFTFLLCYPYKNLGLSGYHQCFL